MEGAFVGSCMFPIVRNDGATGSSPSGTTTFSREIRDVRPKGLSLGWFFGSCLDGFGRETGPDPSYTPQ